MGGMDTPAFYSRFGGLWIDDTDSDRVLARIEAIPDLAMRRQVNKFIRDGFVVLPQAVPASTIDTYLDEYEVAAASPGRLQIEVPMEGGRQAFSREKSLRHGSKVLDTGMLLTTGQDLCFAPPVAAFLETVFGEKALAFQTLHFEVGSTQAIHQDTAYVVVDAEPLQLVASWLALEDVQEGSGELTYFIGGHRIREHVYADGTSKHWNAERDGHPHHDAHLHHLHAEAERRGLEVGRFLPKKGDVLLWHADLPHGGGAVTRPGVTRRSLVTHYCPLSRDPYYLQFIPEDWRRKTPARGGNAFVSLYFPPQSLAAAA
jgi:ectoine hydroxylase-related dioxygenase (phytanoyl-CoA dioxygenase family)